MKLIKHFLFFFEPQIKILLFYWPILHIIVLQDVTSLQVSILQKFLTSY